MLRLLATISLLPAVACAQATFISENFDAPDGTIYPAITPGTATLTGVQQYAGLGPPGYQFGGSFLRSATGNTITIALADLPPHTGLSIHFLFAAIDSLDGTGTFPEGDFLNIRLDGTSVFRESFANATASQDQTYVGPPAAILARRVDLGFGGPGGFFTDSAYNFAADTRFSNIPHTAPTALFSIQMEGPGIQSIDDESWAMDNLRVIVEGLAGCGPADVAGRGAAPLPDGQLDNNDFIVFIDWFFNHDPRADRGIQGGQPGSDGLFNNNDFIVFINQFFSGC